MCEHKMAEDIKLKKCPRCGNRYPATNEFFYRNKSNKDGLISFCKKCEAVYRKDYISKNKEMIKTSKAKYNRSHKDRLAELNKEYRAKNKESSKIKQKIYYSNPKVKLASLINYHKRHARKNSLAIDFTIDDWERCLDYFNHSCAYCGKVELKLEQDHFIPKSKGGSYIKSNIVPSCHSCNAGKRNKEFSSWYKSRTFYSLDREMKILKFIDETANEKSSAKGLPENA